MCEKQISVNHNSYKFVEAVCRSNLCENIVNFWSCSQEYIDWLVHFFNQRHVLSTYCDTRQCTQHCEPSFVVPGGFLNTVKQYTERSVVNS